MLRAITNLFHLTLSSSRMRISRVRAFPLFVLVAVLFILPIVYGKTLSPAVASAFSIGEFIDKAFDKVFLFVPNVIHGISSKLVVFAGQLFSWSIQYSTSGETYSNLKFITTTWTLVRDLINSFFIFIVLYIAFSSVLTSEGDPSKAINRRTITNLVLAALLINFSLFFVKIAIDTSNVVSRGLYYRIETTTSDNQSSFGPVNAIVAGLKLQTELKESTNTTSDLPAQLVAVLGAIIVDLVTFAVFISIAFMFIARIIVLVGIMIVSPVLFAGMIFPAIGKGGSDAKGFSDKIIAELKSQVIWPPVFLVVCFIVVRMIEAMNEATAATTGGKGFADAFSGDTGAFSIFLNYGLIIAALVGGAKAAKSMGTKGSLLSGKVNKYTAAWGGAAMAGAGAMAYRNAAGAGRWATSVGGEKSIGKRLERGAETSRMARTTLRLGKTIGSGTGDIRNAGKLIEKTPLGLGKLAGGALGATGVSSSEFGKASTKTFASHGFGVKGRSAEDIEKKTESLIKSDFGPAALIDMMERGTFLNDANKSAILSEKGKGARAAIIKHIKDKLKDDPEKQKELLDKLFSVKVHEEMGPDNKMKDIFENQLLTNKDLKKELGKEYEAISKSAASVQGRKAIEADGKEAENFEVRYTELQAAFKNGTITPEDRKEKDHLEATGKVSLGAARERYQEIAKLNPADGSAEAALRDELKKRIDIVEGDFEKLSDEDFLKLPSERMKEFQGKISKKQVELLSKTLEEGEKYKSEQDKKNLEELAKSIRLENPKSDAAKALASMAISGKGGFGEMNIKLVDAIESSTSTDALKNVVSSMHPEEFSEALFKPETQGAILNQGSDFLTMLPKSALTKAIKDQKETHFDADVDKFLRDSYKEIDKKYNDLSDTQRLAIEAAKTTHGDNTPQFIEAKKSIDKTFGQQRRLYGAARNQLKAAKYDKDSIE